MAANDFVHLRVPDFRQAVCGAQNIRLTSDEAKVTCPRCRVDGSPLRWRTAQIWGGLNFSNELWHRGTKETLVNSLVFSDRRVAQAALDGLLIETLNTNPYIRGLSEEHYDASRDDWFN